MSNMHCVKF